MKCFLPVWLFLSLVCPAWAQEDATFREDLDFLKQHTGIVLLKRADGSGLVAVAPRYQGRVMTSSFDGLGGRGMGWINREAIASDEVNPHINVYGGEDRFWLGPEGGQFSIFFKQGDPFDLEHWHTPGAIDTMAYNLVEKSDERAVFEKKFSLVNFSGTELKVGVTREIRLVAAPEMEKRLGVKPGAAMKWIGFHSRNTITNRGDLPWKKETGLLSVWILGMFPPSPGTTVVVPYQEGPDAELGPTVNDNYFGKVPADRLVAKPGVLFFKGDGQFRSKIGLSPQRAREICGAYDAEQGVLTLVHYDKPAGAVDYVNSMWEIQDRPYAGDAVNSYNDGPPEPGKKPLGPFYELETSSPAAALDPGASLTHVHRTFHFAGPREDLDRVAQAALGVSIAEIEAVFSP